MKIVNKRKKKKSLTLKDMTYGDDVFIFPNEQDDGDFDPCIAVNPIELGATRVKKGSKGKRKRSFNVRDWLIENDYVAVVSLDSGVITVHPEEIIVVLMDVKLVIEGEK
ncbi:MAG: hypothetical protein ACTSW7_00880 [Candidatus Thorarchaeota archaeon]|nr:hypothetical protein [Thermoplasmatales archaeon]